MDPHILKELFVQAIRVLALGIALCFVVATITITVVVVAHTLDVIRKWLKYR